MTKNNTLGENIYLSFGELFLICKSDLITFYSYFKRVVENNFDKLALKD